jgi:peptidyl-tRNA hydrolase
MAGSGIKHGDKLFVIVRNDLSAGSQAVQGMHAMRQFIADHPESEKEWFEVSNHIAFLKVDDEVALLKMADRLSRRGMKVSMFREPDLDDSLTAIATDYLSKEYVLHLKLALS